MSRLPKVRGTVSVSSFTLSLSPSKSLSEAPSQTEPITSKFQPSGSVHISPAKAQPEISSQLPAPEIPAPVPQASVPPTLSFTEQIIKKRLEKMTEDKYPELAVK